MDGIKLNIGGLKIRIDGIAETLLPANTLRFRADFAEADATYTFHTDGAVPPVAYPLIYRRPDIAVFRKGTSLEARLLALPGEAGFYAYYEERNEREADVYFNPAYRHLMDKDTIFISLLALERHEARRPAFVLHCACMDFGGKAILFSGPSGIGKSTHAGLWCGTFPDKARIVNGDRCLLVEAGGTYRACGWPVCGTSGICLNEQREVSALVLLQQGAENRVIAETPARHFRQVLAQTTVNYWNAAQTEGAMAFVSGLLRQVKCLTYACNISREAVLTLHRELETGRQI